MGSLIIPSKLNTSSSVLDHHQTSLFIFKTPSKTKKSHSPVARLFGPSIFEASKLKVLFLGVDEKKHPGNLPRTYTLTHSDITSKLTLAISQNINNSQLQGWYNKLYRDEVVAEWRKVKENMSLHVHCHISGGHFLLDLCARLRLFIFTKELPLVLKAFAHGDGNLLNNYPDLQEALVWVYFHSNIPEFNRVECWGPLKEAGGSSFRRGPTTPIDMIPSPCQMDCSCCFPSVTSIPWSKDVASGVRDENGTPEGLDQKI
ncbi:protein STAY-GREEN 1, chloroplastic-like [Bidens hawaiensis]|uniref:protein STAY-GREEN 1, chloroplastic-like n=1 Tax=Bidens hawaiensis TaxID=980011 RepID=UPI00404B55AF